jgi:cytochrome P450/NADPH-cytochrome P450 reductase
MLLQNFDFHFENPSYELVIQQTLTIKPDHFFMHATLRKNIDPVYLERMLHGDITTEGNFSDKDRKFANTSVMNGKPKLPMTILYGSNSGTCEALAQSLARVAGSKGYAVQINPLDSAVNTVPKEQPVVMICSSYEGQPPDNAARFVSYINGLKSHKQLDGIKYAVYGVGNRKLRVISSGFRLLNS